MDRVLLDTDILSEILKAKNPVVSEHARKYEAEHGSLIFSAITVMEIVKGFQQAGRADALAKFLTRLISRQVLVFDQACAEKAGRI